MIDNKIVTVIVTYNRLELLKQCINAVNSQSLLTDIIVVNNGSTDGTKGWLESHKNISVISQDNQGGAGGFHEGIKYAFNLGYEWIWIMDDDGIPDINCLQQLHEFSLKYNAWYVAPNLIDFTGKSHFNSKFEFAPFDFINDIGGPFNAILLNRNLVKLIGYPNKKFFIWGDEFEYTDRIIELGVPVYTLRNAIHRHKSTAYDEGDCPRAFFFIRNRIWRYRLAKGVFIKRNNLKFEAVRYIYRLFFKALIRLNFKQVIDVIKGVYHGSNSSPIEF